MKCVICKQGETRDGTATVPLERNGMTFVVKSVPARVCTTCGEEYLDEKITVKLLRQAEDAVRAGVQVDIREYVEAHSAAASRRRPSRAIIRGLSAGAPSFCR